MRTLLLSWLMVSLLPAQTYVVDVNNGPGTQFTSIAAAVATVPSGATLLIRAGSYQTFTINAKALTVLGDPGVNVLSTVTVRNTLAGQQVTLAGLNLLPANAANGPMMQLTDCAGPVLLDRLTTPAVLPMVHVISVFWSFLTGLNVQRCDQVVIRSSTITTTHLIDSFAVVDSCLLRGSAAGLTATNFPVDGSMGLSVGGGRCDVADSQLVGGDGMIGWLDNPGLNVNGSIVTVRTGTIRSGAFAGATPGPALLIVSASLRVDPSVVITASSTMPYWSPPTFVSMPSLTSTGAPPGGTMTAVVSTLNGQSVALFVGLLGPRLAIPGLPEVWWLNPTQSWPHAIGVQQASAPVRAATTVPNIATLRGIAVAWQAITIVPAGLAMSNASVALVQ